jgi:hypothetical protein
MRQVKKQLCSVLELKFHFSGHAVAQAISCGGQSGNGAGFSLSTSAFL